MKIWVCRVIWKIFPLWLCLLATAGRAQPILPPDPYFELTTWSFDDTNWYSDLGYPPLSFTNLNNPPSFDDNALQVDTNLPAWLQYNIVESDLTTNLTFTEGTIELWVLPDWNSATNGGTGPGAGDWGRLIDVGAFSTNNPSSWWSLYFSPDGNNIYFSSETNGVFTNYLTCPISWDTNTWHFLALTYSRFITSELYIDGQLATNGARDLYVPTSDVASNGFFVGSDITGWMQSRVLIDDLATYNYPLSAYEVTNDYAAGLQILNGGGSHADDGGGPTLPGGGGDGGGTNGGGSGLTYTYTPPDYGTNLWIATSGLVSNTVPLLLSNTLPDILYEIQGCTDLAQGVWISEGFVNGSELTNWTPASIFVNYTGNLFLRARSWADDTGTGIPDWWWLQYFGQITNVDAYASAAGDGYSNLQKFQAGLDPTNYYNPNGVGGFFGCLDATGTNVVLEWSNAPGPVTGYIIQRGIYNVTNGNYDYSEFTVSSNAIFFVDTGAINSDNAWNNIYNLYVVYPDGSLSGTNTWYAWYAEDDFSGPPFGAPLPGNVYAYVQSTETNVLITWTPAAGAVTNYVVLRGIYDTTNYDYDYTQIANLSSNATDFSDTGAIQNANSWNDNYEVEAVYLAGGLSQPASTGISTNSPPPTGFTAAVDSTGTNVLLTWTPPEDSTVTNYILERAIYNPGTGSYGGFSQIGQVNGSTTTFEDVGAITGNNSLNNAYQIKAVNQHGVPSVLLDVYMPGPPAIPNGNIYITACLTRNGTGRWQVMFSGAPTNSTQTIQLVWTSTNSVVTTQNISTTNLINGIYSIPDTNVVNLLGASLSVQLFDVNGNPGQVAQAGMIYADAPYFVDGRQHMKQNLEFLVCAASHSQPYAGTFLSGSDFYWRFNQTATNFEEFSFLHHDWASDYPLYGIYGPFVVMDNLWPFTANYSLDNDVAETNRNYDNAYGDTNFNFAINFTTNIPAPPILGSAGSWYIIQPGFQNNLMDQTDDNTTNSANWGVTFDDTQTTASLQSGYENLFGLSYENGLVIYWEYYDFGSGPPEFYGLGSDVPNLYAWVASGNNATVDSAQTDGAIFAIGGYASQCPAPTLVPVNYYFAPLSNPNDNSANLPAVGQQPFPLPIDDSFNVTNQTPPLIVGTVGQPMIVGGWAKYSVSGSSPAKYAYLGQYFETNALLLDSSGATTTNSAGILSPYGEFFPLQAGQAELVTMPDIDSPYEQGTSIVDVVSINVDANHDGTMDFSYSGPDQTSPSRPFRFWINDNTDSGDDGGDGIPGQGAQADGVRQNVTPIAVPYAGYSYYQSTGYSVQGRRDLVDFFPVYLNIGSLFQSNTLSAGISVTDTNYQFVLSQADSALRFAYTDLTPTNYMSFLQDTNESGNLAYASLTTISNSGVNLPAPFLNGIATNNQGVILVEAWKSTMQPLVLTIYHGTNQIAQTQLYLSISGVEQMFRHKNLLVNSAPPAMADRLTDASVPNEPDTTDNNFVFLHGYNVNPQQARGWDADFYKRMYWSGSHAKFYGVTWDGYYSQIPGADVTINLQTNIVNAFNTAPLLSDFLDSLSGTNIVAAHSLGNIVVLSTLNDYSNQNIGTYFMIDAAVPVEALQGSATPDVNMYYPSWISYADKLNASHWWQLFPTNDARNTLTWNNRLSNLQNADVYNFYSSGEEVLREYTNGVPPSELVGSLDQIEFYIENEFLNIGKPVGTYTWAWQEMLKGQGTFEGLLSSTHGGWKFNSSYYSNNILMPDSQAVLLPNSQLQTNAFFDVTSSQFGDADLALYGSGGSAYAQSLRNRILSDTIPALTLPVGANPVTALDEPGNPHNFNMSTNTFENGWPAVRLQQPDGSSWHHSDCRQVAYTFTYQLFDNMVTIGGLQ